MWTFFLVNEELSLLEFMILHIEASLDECEKIFTRLFNVNSLGSFSYIVVVFYFAFSSDFFPLCLPSIIPHHSIPELSILKAPWVQIGCLYQSYVDFFKLPFLKIPFVSTVLFRLDIYLILNDMILNLSNVFATVINIIFPGIFQCLHTISILIPSNRFLF